MRFVQVSSIEWFYNVVLDVEKNKVRLNFVAQTIEASLISFDFNALNLPCGGFNVRILEKFIDFV